MLVRVYINLNDGEFSAIGTDWNEAPTTGGNYNGKGDLDGDTKFNVGIAVGAQIENAKGGRGHDCLKGNDLANTLEGNGGADTLEGGKGNDVLKGGSGNDTYKFDGTYGIDTIEDSGGDGSIVINGQTISGGSYKIESIYKNEATGYQYIQVNGGADLLVLKEGDDNRIIINNWSADNLGINLPVSAPVVPQTTLMGDFKKAVGDGVLVSETGYLIANNNYVNAGVEINAKDMLYGDGNGTSTNDVIDGGGGDDFITGEAGNDYLIGNTGSDLIQGGLGSDTIMGGAGDDTLHAATFINQNKVLSTTYIRPASPYLNTQASGLNWAAGYNSLLDNGVPFGQIYTWNGTFNNIHTEEYVASYIDGGAGDDAIQGDGGDDYLIGGIGKDLIYAGFGADIILGGADNDFIYGDLDVNVANDGNDVIDGGQGEDYLIGGGGVDIIFGGSENDHIWGDSGNTTATIFDGNDYINGGAGDDQLVGGGGNDTLIGGTGADSLFGGEGNDYLEGGTDGSNDVLSGEAGDDTIVGGEGADSLYGGAGSDTIYASDADTLSGQDKDDKIVFLGGGNATTVAVNANTTLGGAAITLNLGTAAINLLDGLVGKGDATYTFADGTQIKQSELIGTRLNSVVNIASASNAIFGGKLADTLQATGTANSSLFGGQGNDILIGNDGNNALNGGLGDDNLIGGLGNDTLNGSAGNDVMSGGDGTDTYLFSRGDGADNVSVQQSSKQLDDIIQLGVNISPSDIVLTRAPSGYRSALQLSIVGTADSITLSSYFNNEYIDYKDSVNYKINNTLIRFADGTVWTHDYINSLIVATTLMTFFKALFQQILFMG